ncbi:MAG: TonB-dependent receptor [Pseudomonadales bacterium]|nr:TonB-dependent receptor [Pseudomonadales bacterium]
MQRFLPCSLPISLVLVVALASDAQALPDMEEIVVRGELRDEGLMKVAASVTVQRPDARRDVVAHLDEMLGRTVNVNFASGASRGRYFQIRGIGETGQFAEPLNASVGTVLDGVDLSGVAGAATTYDLEQVEIFRGPQGTLYGANALAGLINLVSAAPTETLYLRADVDAANYDGRGVGGVLSGPIAESFAFRLAAYNHRDDGFLKNDFLGRDDTNRRDETTLRSRVDWTGEHADARLTLGYVDVDNGYDAFSLDNNRHTLSDEPGQDTQRTVYGSLVMNLEPLPEHALTVTLGHAGSRVDYGYDEDWTYVGFHPDGYSSTDDYRRDWETSSADIRLVSPAANATRWVAGLYALHQEVDLARSYTFLPAPYASQYDVDRLAVYGEVAHDFTDRLSVRVGLRGERHKADFDDSEGVSASPRDTMLGGRLVMEYALDQLLTYGALTRGYKAGGFNTSGTLDADLRSFDPESLWNLELGLKGELADGRVSLRAAAFWMERRDVQIDTSIVRVRPDNSAEFIDYVGNAAEGFNRGIELEIDWQILETLRAEMALGLLDTQYDKFVNGAGERLDGRRQAHAPGYQYFAALEYRPRARWFLRAELEGRDAFYFSDSHGVKSPSSDLLNASAGYEAAHWKLAVWARNLTGEKTQTRGFFFGNDPRDGYTGRAFVQLGEPRRVGLTLTLEM